MSKVGGIFEQIGLLICLYLISYQLITFVWGNQGLIAHRKLLEVQQQFQTHYEQLEKHQQDLVTLSDKIRTDPSYITIEARGLGYYQNQDKLILVNTWSQSQPAPSPGDQILPDSDMLKAGAPRGVWFFSLLLTAGLWLIIRILHFGRNDILPHELSFRDREKFPRVQHGKTSGGNPSRIATPVSRFHSRRNNHSNHKQNYSKGALSTAGNIIVEHGFGSLDRPGSITVLTTEPFLPNQPGEERYQALYRR